MFIINGIIIVLGSVIGGFMMINGPLHVLIQPSEFIVIGGAALGSAITGTSIKRLMMVVKQLPIAIKGSPYTKAAFTEVLKLQYDVYINAKKSGLLSLEEDVNKPEESAIFKKYPVFLANHHAIE